MNNNYIVCRCEEITLKDIEKAIKKGADTIQDVKKITRAGMGPCQGTTCYKIISKIINQKTGKLLSEITLDTQRPPSLPISLKVLSCDKK